ncbi:hypothetical protein Mth01_44920 [Sphaerimonospora thailandensis]|uniref:Serine phosphatase RsbU (Regulator of sigma subunit) n=1 Tax=Sphaerimonospora thailandensis TaxID=795644 RepID=A0A8J3RCL7_9ACTN|nr:hypothetical protein Mth01_44920 [Sphaerimonospora thailandensis]
MECFFDREPVEGRVRPAILRSWRRCRAAGLAPGTLDFGDPVELDWDGPLVRAARPVVERVLPVLADADAALLLGDEKARLLLLRTGDRALSRELDARHHWPGVSYAEEFVGTNAFAGALRERLPFPASGFDHLSACLQPFAATGVPVLDPLTGQVRGAVAVVCLIGREHPAMGMLAQRVADAIERRLLEHSSERERDLLQAFLRTEAMPRPLPGGGLPPGELTPGDRVLLEDRAVELIARGQRAAVQVPLSGGRVAVLRSVPRIESAGVVGVLAQVRIEGGPWEPMADLPFLAPPAPIEGPMGTMGTVGSVGPVSEIGAAEAAKTVAAATKPGVAETGRRPEAAPVPEMPVQHGSYEDPWLLLAGEPGVGRLAASARRRLRILFEAAMGIGQTLDVVRTAEELAEATVSRFADLVTVDLAESVLRGQEADAPSADLRRVAIRGADGTPGLSASRGQLVRYPPSSSQARCLAEGWPVLSPGPGGENRSLIAAPLSAHGNILGVVTFLRRATPFADDDLSLAEQLSARTGVCIDNARRFTREHATALALQRAMLPRRLPEQNAVEAAYRYQLAYEAAGYAWFDVIPLSGARVALVVGEVAGSGLQAAAAMGRLRTTISNFSALDLPPEEILAHLDDLVCRLVVEQAEQAGDDAAGLLGDIAEDTTLGRAGDAATGTTCLYAVYDPTSQCCGLASAGHPPPAVVGPDGTVKLLHTRAGPPLGRGGPPFETTELSLPEGSRLVLYTGGLLADDPADPRIGTQRLRQALDTDPGRTAEETCASALSVLPHGRCRDDVIVLAACTRALSPGHIAYWDLPADPAAVRRVRAEAARQLSDWNLDDLVFTTELIFSELVTNAIRYGAEPIRARLLLDRTLICEVFDASDTSPHPRRAVATDEGGRGLFLVAQLSERWGTRYTRRGKVIWAEQSLDQETQEGTGEPWTVLGLPE